MLMFTA